MSDLHGSPAAIIKLCFIVKAPQSVWAKSIIQKLALKKIWLFLLWLCSRLIKYTSSLFISSSHLFLTWKILPMQHERIQSVTNKWWMRVEMEREWWVYAEKGRRKTKETNPSQISRCTSSQPVTSTMQRCNKGEVNRQYPNSASTKLAPGCTITTKGAPSAPPIPPSPLLLASVTPLNGGAIWEVEIYAVKWR